MPNYHFQLTYKETDASEPEVLGVFKYVRLAKEYSTRHNGRHLNLRLWWVPCTGVRHYWCADKKSDRINIYEIHRVPAKTHPLTHCPGCGYGLGNCVCKPE